jgi:LmbE family N-acetylglucosaminyl deacetylase
VFLELPDGGPGAGYPRTGHSSLQRLWLGLQPSITAVDGSATYSRDSLGRALTRLIDEHGADVVRTQNYFGRFGDGDHGDHHAVAYLVREAVRGTDTGPRLVGYHDYEIADLRPNVAGAVLAAKRAAFFGYARFDDQVCGSVAACGTAKFGAWLTRQYRL